MIIWLAQEACETLNIQYWRYDIFSMYEKILAMNNLSVHQNPLNHSKLQREEWNSWTEDVCTVHIYYV